MSEKPRWLTPAGQSKLKQKFSLGDRVVCRRTKQTGLVLGVMGYNVWCYLEGRAPVNRTVNTLARPPQEETP